MALATDISGVHAKASKKNGERREHRQPSGEVVNPNGLVVPRLYTTPGAHPFDRITWERRTSTIKERDGRVVFEMNDVEVPSAWSQLATDIIAQKYFPK